MTSTPDGSEEATGDQHTDVLPDDLDPRLAADDYRFPETRGAGFPQSPRWWSAWQPWSPPERSNPPSSTMVC